MGRTPEPCTASVLLSGTCHQRIDLQTHRNNGVDIQPCNAFLTAIQSGPMLYDTICNRKRPGDRPRLKLIELSGREEGHAQCAHPADQDFCPTARLAVAAPAEVAYKNNVDGLRRPLAPTSARAATASPNAPAHRRGPPLLSAAAAGRTDRRGRRLSRLWPPTHLPQPPRLSPPNGSAAQRQSALACTQSGMNGLFRR